MGMMSRYAYMRMRLLYLLKCTQSTTSCFLHITSSITSDIQPLSEKWLLEPPHHHHQTIVILKVFKPVPVVAPLTSLSCLHCRRSQRRRRCLLIK